MQVFFACGTPKSGTTWLQRILDSHPQVCCSGEGHFIRRFSAPVARVVNTYNRGLDIEARQVYEGRPYYGGVDQDEFDDIVRGFVRRRLAARATAETLWVGDKTPAYTRDLPQLHRLFPEARIIHIVRDPRDVAVSRMAHSRRAGAAEAMIQGSDQYRETLEAAARMWREAVAAVDAFTVAHPGAVHELSYRDLFDHPIAEAERLFSFLGVNTQRVLIERIVAANSFEALTGRAPGQEDPTAFLRKGLPGDWKSRLDADGARFIADTCGDLMAAKRFAA